MKTVQLPQCEKCSKPILGGELACLLSPSAIIEALPYDSSRGVKSDVDESAAYHADCFCLMVFGRKLTVNSLVLTGATSPRAYPPMDPFDPGEYR